MSKTEARKNGPTLNAWLLSMLRLEVARKTRQVYLFDAAQQVRFVPWAAVVSCGGMVLVADCRRLDQHSPIALWLEFQFSADHGHKGWGLTEPSTR